VTAHAWRHVHLAMMGVWAILLVPTIILWRESLVWIVAMSWYANFVGHFSAWQASRAEDKES
jgi:hypothetical protein